MITDEQAKIAIEAYWSNETDELPAMRKALEAYEANKWVKFDVNDVSTWPPMTKQPFASIPVMVYCTGNKETFYGSKFVTNLHKLLPTYKGYAYWTHPFYRDNLINVTHWQPLPTFKE